MVGVILTVMGTVTGALGHNNGLEPTTVYVVLVPGDTLTVEPVSEPGCHTYVEVPLAFNVSELPEQIVAVFTEAVMVGVVFTVTATVLFAAGQPAALTPETVYTVFDVGDTLTVEPVSPPGCHV